MITFAAASLGTAGWGVYDGVRAHDCLNSGYSAGITERGCELHTDHGTILIALHGPGLGLTLLAIAASIVLVTMLIVLRVCRVSGRRDGGAPAASGTSCRVNRGRIWHTDEEPDRPQIPDAWPVSRVCLRRRG